MTAVEQAQEAHGQALRALAAVNANLAAAREELIEAREQAGEWQLTAALAPPVTVSREDADRDLDAVTRASAKVLALESAQKSAEGRAADARAAVQRALAESEFGRQAALAVRAEALGAQIASIRLQTCDLLGELAAIIEAFDHAHPDYTKIQTARRACSHWDANFLHDLGRETRGGAVSFVVNPTVPIPETTHEPETEPDLKEIAS